jgi:signal transduction histidine kinase
MKKLAALLGAVTGIGAVTRYFSPRSISERRFRQVLTGLGAGSSPDAVLQQMAERAAKLTGSEEVYVEQIDINANEVRAAAAFGQGSPQVGTRSPYQGSVAAEVTGDGLPRVVGNRAVVPLIADGKAMGALFVSRKYGGYRHREISRLRTLADLTAVALRREIILESLEQQRKQLEQAVRTRDEMSRILSHDLRNPITTIAGAAAAMRRPTLSPEAHTKLLDMIERSAYRMNRLIQDLLDNVLIERNGALPLNPAPQPVERLAEEVCELSRMLARTKTLQIQCLTEGNAIVYADRDRLLQALGNLIDNAIKFTPAGGLITVKSEVRHDAVRFSVSDSGPGIPETNRDRIFEPYWQDQKTAASSGGIGLGLAITKRIVEQHGGKIWVETKQGPGSTFVFTIPTHAQKDLN